MYIITHLPLAPTFTKEKMNGYSKIKIIDAQNPRSMDFSDSTESTSNTTPKPKPTSETQETSHIKNTVNTNTQDSLPEQEDEKWERFGVVLSRNCSVSSSTSGFQLSAVKKAFSMRRSSSVSERYSRIHDQSVTVTSFLDDDHDEEEGRDTMRGTRRSIKKKHKGGKILKACKLLFGL